MQGFFLCLTEQMSQMEMVNKGKSCKNSNNM